VAHNTAFRAQQVQIGEQKEGEGRTNDVLKVRPATTHLNESNTPHSVHKQCWGARTIDRDQA